MKAWNKKKKPKHTTKCKYFLYAITRSTTYPNIFRQQYSCSKKKSYVDMVAVMFNVHDKHFCIERYYPQFELL